MSSSSGAEATLSSPTELQGDALVVNTMDATLMVATTSGDVQQLKDLLKEQESQMTVVVMTKQQAAASAEKPHRPQQGNMNLRLLALASSGSCEELKILLNWGDGQASAHSGTVGGLTTLRRASSYASADTEANGPILGGVTAEGDTALHVVAAYGHGGNLFTRSREAYGDGDNFLESARIIYGKARNLLLFMQNNNGDTPLHCAARAGKSNMVACLIDLASIEGENRMKELLRTENKHSETALHDAVRIGNNDIVQLLMGKDSELASFPAEDGGASPMYLAYVLKQDFIVEILANTSHGKLSYSGQNGQNVLHAAVVRRRDLRKLLKWNEIHLCSQNKDLTTQRDENGSTPLHFAAAIQSQFGPSSTCRQVLEANPDALYQPDNEGFFPIHVAASVGAMRNVLMFATKYPGSAGLRDAKGRTFLHVAVARSKMNIIRGSCRNLSLSWIMNMVDNDGNTALHLAVETGSLRMFCLLLGNPQVNLNLPNNRGETPLDIAQYKLYGRPFYYIQKSEAQICRTLEIAGAVNGVRRQDHFEDAKTASRNIGESMEMQVVKDSTTTVSVGSVPIATVAFGATFAIPGGYIADDHSNRGTPTLARRYAFDAFIASNTLAFIFSMMATTAVMRSGNPLVNPRRRSMHVKIAFHLVSVSITSLTAAFALGAYVVLAPVAHKTAVATCVLSALVPLYKNLGLLEATAGHLLLPPLLTRKGLVWAAVNSASVIIVDILLEYWPLIFIFGWAAHASPSPKIQAPAPLAST